MSAQDTEVKLVCFHLHGQEYGAPIGQIKETLALKPLTPVFLTAPWLAGIINLRGDIVAIVDLAIWLGMAPTATDESSRIVIIRHEGRSAGMLVDRMAELRTCNLAELQPPPPTVAAMATTMLRGIATVEHNRALRVLDLAPLFDTDRLRAHWSNG